MLQKNEQSYIYISMNLKMHELTRQEKIAARYVMENQEKIIYLGITELAELTGTSEATIIRMCKKLGYKGFQELKIQVAKELVEPMQKINESVSPDDSVSDIVSKSFNSTISTLQSTRKGMDEEAFRQAAEVILTARRILIFGLGNSAAIAVDAQHKFLRAGFAATAFTDNHMQIIASSSIISGDVAIGISHSGSSKDVVDALSFAKSLGATTICITNYGRPPISKKEVSDICLFTISAETKFRIYGGASRIAQLAIVDALFTYVSVKKGDAAIQNFERLEQALVDKKY